MLNNKDKCLEKFINIIDNNLMLRKKHLLLLHDILHKLEFNNHKFTFIRTTIPEIYAQYEGFLKFSFLHMFNTLKAMGLSNNTVNIRLLIFPLLTTLENHLLSQDKKSQKILDVFNKAFVEEIPYFEITEINKYVINQKTLLPSLAILDIPTDNLPLANLDALYGRRNSIAHGELDTSNQFAISRLSDITDRQLNAAYELWLNDYYCILSCLDQIKDFFINYLVEETYLKAIS